MNCRKNDTGRFRTLAQRTVPSSRAADIFISGERIGHASYKPVERLFLRSWIGKIDVVPAAIVACKHGLTVEDSVALVA